MTEGKRNIIRKRLIIERLPCSCHTSLDVNSLLGGHVMNKYREIFRLTITKSIVRKRSIKECLKSC